MVAALILIALASLLGVIAAGNNVLGVDLRVSDFIQRWQGSLPDALQQMGSTLGGTLFAIAALIACVVVTLTARWRSDAIFVLTVALFRLASLVLKGIFDSPRPTDDLVNVLRHYGSTGYPSGHSMTFAMIATTLAILVWRHTEDARWRNGTIVAGALLTLLVGWSRIWAGAHWPTDVLGGWMYGVGFVLLSGLIVYSRKNGSFR